VSATNVALLVVYALGMSIGQVLFKLSADRSESELAKGFLGSLLGNGYFWFALILYGALTLQWTWMLTRLPLSRAYPFVALAFVFTPVLAFMFFGEQLDPWYFVGLALILSGLGVLVWKTA
jgi:drug/metabolite transporter (DMT)-like permease